MHFTPTSQAAPVSVVIATHNRREALEVAIDSILSQSRPPSEIIIVDDASDDDTASFLESLGRFCGVISIKLHLLSNNSGVSHCRNLGAQSATSPWLAFLDSDDTWEPNKLEVQLTLAEANPELRLFYCDENWVRNGVKVNQQKQHQKLGGSIFAACVETCLIGVSTILISKSLFDEQKGFDETFPVCEDYDLWLRISSAESIGYSQEKLVTKNGGNNDQLSIRYLAMDQWRLRSLLKLYFSKNLSPCQMDLLRSAVISKSRILAKSFSKHKRLHHAEIFANIEQAFADKAEISSMADFELLQILRPIGSTGDTTHN